MNGCRRCGGLDHWADGCQHNIRAKDRQEHEARIASYVALFPEHISAWEKQQMIKAENRLWYGTDLPPGLKQLSKGA